MHHLPLVGVGRYAPPGVRMIDRTFSLDFPYGFQSVFFPFLSECPLPSSFERLSLSSPPQFSKPSFFPLRILATEHQSYLNPSLFRYRTFGDPDESSIPPLPPAFFPLSPQESHSRCMFFSGSCTFSRCRWLASEIFSPPPPRVCFSDRSPLASELASFAV